jgi:hypothetical protein
VPFIGPVITKDGNAVLPAAYGVTGMTQAVYYASVEDHAGVPWVSLYEDAARTIQAGTTFGVLASGPAPLIAGGGRYLGGNIVVDLAHWAPDADIEITWIDTTAVALPLVERIALAIMARLATVTLTNGYAFDLSEIVRPKRCGVAWTPKSLGVRLLQANPGLSEGTVGNPPAIEITQPFQLDLIVAVSETSSTPAEAWLNLMASEVNRAMMSDPQWTVAGERLAIWSRLAAILYPEPTTGLDMMTLVYEAQHRVAESDFRVRV